MEKYTSEMINDLLIKIISISTAANMTASQFDGNLSPDTIKKILADLRNVSTEARLIRNRMHGWEFAAFEVILMQEVKKNLENHLHEDEET